MLPLGAAGELREWKTLGGGSLKVPKTACTLLREKRERDFHLKCLSFLGVLLKHKQFASCIQFNSN